jgi:hypothetical protein
MTEETTAAAPAPEQTPQPPAPTLKEMVATVRKAQENDFDKHDREERLKILIRKSTCGHYGNNPLFNYYNPSLEYSLEELKVLVPLERDRWNYAWKSEKVSTKSDKSGKVTEGCYAENRHGLYSVPRTGGRRNPHMSHKNQAIKSASIRAFRKLVEETGTSLRATCKEQEIEYLGLPDAMIPELGAKAMRIAVREVTAQRKAHSRDKRRRQEFSRRTNAGLINTSEKSYVNRGGEYGKV